MNVWLELEFNRPFSEVLKMIGLDEVPDEYPPPEYWEQVAKEIHEWQERPMTPERKRLAKWCEVLQSHDENGQPTERTPQLERELEEIENQIVLAETDAATQTQAVNSGENTNESSRHIG